MTEFEEDLEDLIGDWSNIKQQDFIKEYGIKDVPKIKKNVAESIEEYKRKGLSIFTFFDERGNDKKVEEWLYSNKLKNSELIAKAWLGKYVIEDEVKYILRAKEALADGEFSKELWLDFNQNFTTIGYNAHKFSEKELLLVKNLEHYDRFEVKA